MFIMYLLFLLITLPESQTFVVQDNNTDVTTCVQNIIKHLIPKGTSITYVDLKSNDNDIIKSIQNLHYYTLTSRTTDKKVNHYNKAYIITAGNFNDFKNEFNLLSKEKDWNPNVNFIIIFRKKIPNPLTDLFDILLRSHVYNVVVICGTSNTQMYTYNPLKNYSCGKKYLTIKHCGICSNMSATKCLSKFDIKLKGCTFNVATSFRGPYSIRPESNKKIMGTEQYFLKLLGEMEGFKINYTASYDPDVYPVVKNDMSASGSLGLIQNQDVDIVFGGMLLLVERAEAFSYIYEHKALTDELVVLVKRAEPVTGWKNIYLEFTYLVWFLLFVTFFVFFLILVLIFRINDKCKILLIMWCLFFQHNFKLGANFRLKYFIFQWVVFAFLINIYYQSMLMGLTTHISRNYQISKNKDIDLFKMEPCISNNIVGVIKNTIGTDFKGMDKNCGKTMSSIQTVSGDNKKYTIVLHSLYYYNRFNYTDEFGDFLLYAFKEPMNKIIYAIYFYKGFPKLNILRYNSLRIRESGLLNKHLADLYHEEAKQYKFKEKGFKAHFFLPLRVLLTGVVLSGLSFLFELIIYFIKRYRMY